MATNSISPGFALVKYTALGHDHKAVYPIQPVLPSPGSIPQLLPRVGAAVDPTTWITTTWANVWKPFYMAGDSLVECEFWSKPTPADDPVYLATLALAIVGTASGGTQTVASQGVLTFRSTGGSILRHYFMEAQNVGGNVHDPRPFTDARVTNYAAVMTANTALFGARDNGFASLALNWNTKTNDALRKKYILNA